MEAGKMSYSETGSPQGGVISPLLSNIYLHEVLDNWFVTVVQPRLAGKSFMVRYADDAVIGCEKEEDADRIMKGKSPPICEVWINDTPGEDEAGRLPEACRRAPQRERKFHVFGIPALLEEIPEGAVDSGTEDG
jgi:hypothetical protein